MNDEKLNKLEKKITTLNKKVNSLELDSSDTQLHQNNNDEIDLRLLWLVIWKGKTLIILTTVFFMLGGIVLALMTPNEYKSSALLSPASSSSSSSLSNLASQFGGLASLAGIDLGAAGEDNKANIAMEIVKTWGFLEEFIEQNGIEVEVFASKGWDRATNTLLIDDDIYDVNTRTWVRDFDLEKGETAEPSSWELYEEFSERISVSKNKESGLITLSIEFYSPILAQQWTDKLIFSVNKYFQNRDKEDAITNINYLNDKIENTSLSDMESVFYQLIEEQTKALMLAEVSDEYVFKTISKAKVAEEKSKPERVIIVFLGTFLGGVLGLLFVFTAHLLKNH